MERGDTESRRVEVARQAVEQTVCHLRRARAGHTLIERVCDRSFGRFDVTRILESTNESRSGSEQCSSLVAVRDGQRTERRQSDREGGEDGGDLVGGRFGCRQTCTSVLLNTLRYRQHHRLLSVDALDPCDGTAPVSTCSA